MSRRLATADVPLWITPAQAAAELALSRSTVLRAIARDELPAFKNGQTVRIRRSDFDAWVARCTTGARRSA